MTANKPIRIYINAAEYLELKKQRAFKNDRRKTAQVGEGHGAIVYVLSIVFVAPSPRDQRDFIYRTQLKMMHRKPRPPFSAALVPTASHCLCLSLSTLSSRELLHPPLALASSLLPRE